ncbi:MAG: DUF2321 domain-containing protein [Candidatus Aquicultor sp.]
MDKYDVLHICLNGHIIDNGLENADYDGSTCPICGFPTIDECLNCETKIQDSERDVYIDKPIMAPSHCHSCREPFPWTLTIGNAKDLVHMLDGLTFGDQQRLIQHVGLITKDSPEAVVAAKSAKKLLGEFDSRHARALLDILEDIASEPARKFITALAVSLPLTHLARSQEIADIVTLL